jgi:hypothetical protein
MKRYKLAHDNGSGQAIDGHEIGDDVESRQMVVIGLFSADGKLVGLDVPEPETNSSLEDVSQVEDRPVSPEETGGG